MRVIWGNGGIKWKPPWKITWKLVIAGMDQIQNSRLGFGVWRFRFCSLRFMGSGFTDLGF